MVKKNSIKKVKNINDKNKNNNNNNNNNKNNGVLKHYNDYYKFQEKESMVSFKNIVYFLLVTLILSFIICCILSIILNILLKNENKETKTNNYSYTTHQCTNKSIDGVFSETL
jgi:hypothetical protein